MLYKEQADCKDMMCNPLVSILYDKKFLFCMIKK